MALQRSKSAPHPLSSLPTTTTTPAVLQRSLSSHDIVHSGTGNCIKHVQQTDRRDPFNLSGFFPAMRGGRAWNWLQEEDTEQGSGDTKLEDSMSSDMADGHVEEIIKHEDKMGVLSLGWVLGKIREDEEDVRLASPYSGDEAVDYDSLYLGLCSRRVDGERAISTANGKGGFGPVFLGS
ncbi:hypothetical protein BDN72DRAFT_830366 [Pluteus cervinus]|uniref:Uncharacterized protein n=1 Tax=Pluteus cervinus TaxID=181527 RepID=A0ACD3BGF2_9AGAR|nr:hypothetical protein BDN72DRAFT_830366 [Pluteus cervinus]